MSGYIFCMQNWDHSHDLDSVAGLRCDYSINYYDSDNDRNNDHCYCGKEVSGDDSYDNVNVDVEDNGDNEDDGDDDDDDDDEDRNGRLCSISASR